MAQPVIQTSFISGEWAPSLNARVDLDKYHSGAALLRNFYVDYRGGATRSPGSKYILQTKGNTYARVIPFQASLTVGYVIEIGNGYMRFFANGAPILVTTVRVITNITAAGVAVVTSAGHGYSNGDWVYLYNINGMDELDGNYFIVANQTVNTYELRDLRGNPVNSTTFVPYVSGGSSQEIFEIASPYGVNDIAAIKYAQNVNVMILCHPNFPPYALTYTSPTNWSLGAITFGSTVAAPTGQAVATTLGAGTWNYAYVITAVDSNGQESGPSAFATLANVLDIRATPGTNTVTWSSVAAAASYNIYKAELRSGAAVPAGSMFGFIGNCTGTTFIDSNIAPDFAQNYPIVRNPFAGSGVQSIAVTNAGSYTGLTAPSVSFSGGGGSGASAIAVCAATAVAVNAGGIGYNVGDLIYTSYGIVLQVTAVDGGKAIIGISIVNAGAINSGTSISANPYGYYYTSGPGQNATFNLTIGVVSVGIISPGTGYGPAPAVAFSTGAATATATLGAPPVGNPTVPGFFQQRLVLAGPVANPQQFNMSQPGAFYNFNVSDPLQPDDAFQGYLTSGKLNNIHSMIPQPQGLAVLSDISAWLVNGGSPGSAVSATQTVANPQVFSGAGGPLPVVAGENVLYVQSKNSIIRNMVFNWNKQVYTGADITIVSSHLFYGYSIIDQAWAEEPFKVDWAVRNDGVLLSCTFIPRQEPDAEPMAAWTHRDTNGSYRSVATIPEQVAIGTVDAVYTVVQRTLAGVTVQYIERFVEQYYPSGVVDAWQVDAGLQYNGAPILSFLAWHLPSSTIVCLATDNLGNTTQHEVATSAIGGFVLPAPTLPATGYIRVTAGFKYISQLTTLGIDIGNPTIQGKMKFLPAVTVRVKDTLNLSIGTTYDNLVPMDDLIIGNVGKDTNEIVTTAMVTGDTVQTLDPQWQVPGQYCIQSDGAWPASILGLIPQIAVGDTKE